MWASLGYGQGELKIELGREKLSTDTRLLSLAVGAKGRLTHTLSLKSDISLARTDIDKSDYSAQQHVNSQRLRLLLEVQRQHNLASGGIFTPTLEAGLRYDGGDGDKGLGAVLDAVVGYAYPTSGLTMEVRLHTLLGRDDYTEWGISGLIALTAAAGRGLAFSLRPSYGTETSGVQAIWQQNQIDSLGSAQDDYRARLDARLSYGFANGGGSLLLPYSEITYGTSNSYRLGIQWQRDARFNVNLFGERHESNGSRAKHAILLEGRVHF